VPITIELPDIKSQTAFNLVRWAEILATRAPEICVEILSPSNTASEIDEKRALYFDAGAIEVWICKLDGSFIFFVSPDNCQSGSVLCPYFPKGIP
jgi:Uma2 family endonuclease